MSSHIELQPNTPEYRDILYTALIKRDVHRLRKIKENFGKPIHLVKDWFYYELKMMDIDRDFIVIYDTEAIEQFDQFLNSQKEAV